MGSNPIPRLIEESKAAQIPHAHCIFEYIYFARLDSTMDNVNIYDARIRAGKALAASYPVEADLVTESRIPVWLRQWAMRRPAVCPSPLHFTKTAMWKNFHQTHPKAAAVRCSPETERTLQRRQRQTSRPD